MAKFKIEVVEKDCTGCGACVAACPECFDMQDSAKGQKAVPKASEVDEIGCAMDAAEVCPVNCIHILEVESNKKLI